MAAPPTFDTEAFFAAVDALSRPTLAAAAILTAVMPWLVSVTVCNGSAKTMTFDRAMPYRRYPGNYRRIDDDKARCVDR